MPFQDRLRVIIVALSASLLASCGESGSQISQNVSATLLPMSSPSVTYPTNEPLIFEADEGDADVEIARLTMRSTLATISLGYGSCPEGTAMNKQGDLFVVDACNGAVLEYPKGQTKLSKTITIGIRHPSGIAVDSKGNLYVSNLYVKGYPASIEVYPPGETSPSRAITSSGFATPTGLAIDGADNLFIADNYSRKVFEVAPGTNKVRSLGLPVSDPDYDAVDQNTGNLWITETRSSRVRVFSAPRWKLTQTLTVHAAGPIAIANNVSEHQRGTVAIVGSKVKGSGGVEGYIYLYHDGQYQPYETVDAGLGTVIGGLLIDKP